MSERAKRRLIRPRGLVLAAAIASAGCSATGGSSSPPGMVAAPSRRGERARGPSATAAEVTDPRYAVGVGDRLAIQSVGDAAPETVEVEGDGALHFAGGANVRVDGHTTDAIAAQLRRDLGWRYQNCSVRVIEPKSQFIQLFVEGEPARAIPYRGRETVEDMLERVDCKGCRRGHRVRVVRPSKTIHGVPEIFALQLDRELKDRPTGATPIQLEPNDYVYLEKDNGKPGELTRLTESHWYQRPGQWAKQLRESRQSDRRLAKR